MSVSQEQLDAVTSFAAMARMQDSIGISFFVFYIYYVLTTLGEEVSLIFPQKWTRGKLLFVAIRYGTLFFIVLSLIRDYKNFYSITEISCKALSVVLSISSVISLLASNISLGLCLSAMFQAGILLHLAIMTVSVGPSIVTSVFDVVSQIQYPAESVSDLLKDFGYPCSFSSVEQWAESTITGYGFSIRPYVFFATTAVLFILAVVALGLRYKGHNGRLVNVILRDGGLYYMTLVALKFTRSLIYTPAILFVGAVSSSPANTVLVFSDLVLVPILAQRLLINIRMADYMGRQPIASKLLFAPPSLGSEDETTEGELKHVPASSWSSRYNDKESASLPHTQNGTASAWQALCE